MRGSKIRQAQPATDSSKSEPACHQMKACSLCKVKAPPSELFPRYPLHGNKVDQSVTNRQPSLRARHRVAAGSTANIPSTEQMLALKRSKGSLELARMEQFCGVCWKRSRVPIRPAVDVIASVSPYPDALDRHEVASGRMNKDGANDGGITLWSRLLASISVLVVRLRGHQAQFPQNVVCKSSPIPNSAKKAAELSQFYTTDEVAAKLWRGFQEFYDPRRFVIVEPSAGKGAFLKQMPKDSLGIDLDPQYPGVLRANFLDVDRDWLAARLELNRPIAILGNPPFGKGSHLAWQFFNHAARVADVIVFILPPSVRKAAFENRLDRHFHLVAEWVVPEDAFVFQGRPHNVRTVFQIWERRSDQRKLRQVEHSHPDFTFVKSVALAEALADKATVAIRRIGANAGSIHEDPVGKSAGSHYFVQADQLVVLRLKALDLRQAAANAVSIPSLAKSEIVELYKAYLAQRDVDDFAA